MSMLAGEGAVLAEALEAAKELGLSLRHRVLIALLVSGGAAGVAQLARLLGRSSNEVAELVERMEASGLVKRRGNSTVVELAEGGLEELRGLLESAEGRGRVLRLSVLRHACNGADVKTVAERLGVTVQHVYRVPTVRVVNGVVEPRDPKLCSALDLLASILEEHLWRIR